MQKGSMALVDSHVHLDRYTDDEVGRMVREAAQAGVGTLLTIGTDAPSSRAALRLAARHPSVLAAVGVHPTRLEVSGGAAGAARSLRQLLGRDLPGPVRAAPGGVAALAVGDASPVSVGGTAPAAIGRTVPAAIGEVGLDAAAPDLDGQQRFLAACVALAAQHALPLVLHVVGEPAVHEAALTVVRAQPAVRTVAHYFVGGPALAARYLEAGCWISVGRPVTRQAETAVRAAVPRIPLDRLLLETDTYPLPGRATEPRDVATVCAGVAELHGASVEAVAAATTASFWAWLRGGTAGF
ncbi:MAG: TatD family hydrolase [Chloroflexi bacterium]|nr:TatD family hydrolase [Chloroflexota bacterium]